MAKIKTTLEKHNSDLAVEWHPNLNGNLSPSTVSFQSPKKVWWLGKCGHEWEATIKGRSITGSGCPYCSGMRIIVGFNDLETLRPDLFALIDLEKNKDLNLLNLKLYEPQILDWVGECGHKWRIGLNSMVKSPKCRICVAQSKSLIAAKPYLANEWHPDKNKNLMLSDIYQMTRLKVWWLGKCGHEWQARVDDRSYRGNGCPYCDGRKILVGFNDLKTTHPELSLEWHPTKNNLHSIESVSYGVKTKVWWLGKCGHEWQASILSRTLIGASCSTCSPRGFSNDYLSTFYFIEHPLLKARKIGIANNHAGRIDKWINNGWVMIYSITEDTGNNIRRIETKIKKWIRKDLVLSQELEQKDMYGLGGATETFPIDGISNYEIILKIKEVWEEI